MRKILLSVILLFIVFFTTAKANSVLAYQRVRSYYKKSTGTYVNSYFRTHSNSYKFDNWSSKGNYNPYTGKKGYKSWY